MAQTTIQNDKALIAGSGIIYVWEDFSSLVNIGAFRDLVYNHKAETATISFDNVEDIKRTKYFNKGSFDFKLAEVDSSVWNLFNKGLVDITTVPWTTQAITDESIVLNDGKYTLLANKNWDNTRVGNIVVKSSDWATTYTEWTDYEVITTPDGYTGILIVDGGAIASGDTVLVSYDYTPAEYRSITFKTSGVNAPIVARFVHTNNEGKTYTIDLENVSNIKTLWIDFVWDNDDDVATMEIELEGYIKEIKDEITV